MTTNTDIVNIALQCIGTRTTVTDAELTNNSTNESIQANLVMTKLRDELMRMAQWNCGTNTANLTYITSIPGTPENTSVGPTLWQRGLPSPSWAYEYQYPVDCLRPLWVIPSYQTGFSGGVPITTAVTGGSPAWWQGPPQKFKIATDRFYLVTAVAIIAAGTGYEVGDYITLANSSAITVVSSTPNGAGPVIQVATVNGGGGILTATLIYQILDNTPIVGGSLFYRIANNAGNSIAQLSTSGTGTGATFNITQPNALADQRVILTNQEFATLVYMRQVTDPNVMDPLFVDAWANILGSRLAMALSGDKSLANMCVNAANNMVLEARKADGNEGLTINDVTPDWIRARGINYDSAFLTGPGNGFDWGSTWSLY